MSKTYETNVAINFNDGGERETRRTSEPNSSCSASAQSPFCSNKKKHRIKTCHVMSDADRLCHVCQNVSDQITSCHCLFCLRLSTCILSCFAKSDSYGQSCWINRGVWGFLVSSGSSHCNLVVSVMWRWCSCNETSDAFHGCSVKDLWLSQKVSQAFQGFSVKDTRCSPKKVSQSNCHVVTKVRVRDWDANRCTAYTRSQSHPLPLPGAGRVRVDCGFLTLLHECLSEFVIGSYQRGRLSPLRGTRSGFFGESTFF